MLQPFPRVLRAFRRGHRAARVSYAPERRVGHKAAAEAVSAQAAGRHAPEPRLPLLPYAAAVFLGAALLFCLEPMVGKRVLPGLGGAPAVWNACLLFFQGMLLAGYAYAHYGIRRFGVKAVALLHSALIIASLFALPTDAAAIDPPADVSPVGWLLVQLVRSIGLPFFVLSATAPLVQYWLSGTAHPRARDPYFLYAASNLGSLTGLALYPFVLEPLLGLHVQAIGWAVAYVLFAAILVTLAWQTHRQARGEVAAVPAPPVPAGSALRWAGIAFVPSALLLTVTEYVTTDIAPMPLLWLAPLALYLATFVIAFGGGTRAARVVRLAQPALTLILATAVIAGYSRLWLLPLHLFGLTLVAYLAHARLAAERPQAAQLTAFYLWLSVGGVLGGVFGAVVAPLWLMPEVEYALLLTVALLVPGRHSLTDSPTLQRVLLCIGGFSAVGVAVAALGQPGWGMIIAAGAAATLMLRRLDASRLAVTLVVALGLTIFDAATRPADTLSRERNFFGTLRVSATEDAHRLEHGRTVHGVQLTTPAELGTPTTYYSPQGPLGNVFGILMADVGAARVAAVGLGVGTVACYARPGETWDLFEINPAVVRIATDPRLFAFVLRCAPEARIVLGDGRRALQTMSDARYDLIVLDAFSSDAIPAHLLTREAFALYLQRLRPGGLLAVHISNRYLDLAPVLAANAEALGVRALIRNDDVSDGVRRTQSTWVVLASSTERLDPLARAHGWATLSSSPGFRAWTDDFTSLLSVVRAFRPSPTRP